MTTRLQFSQTATAVRPACAVAGRTVQSLAIALGLASWCFVGLPTRATAAEPAQDENQLFVPNAIDRYSFGDRTPGTVYGADGSIEIFLQHEEPTDPKERANWLPAPKGRFHLVTRHYSPNSPILTGDWAPPPVTKR